MFLLAWIFLGAAIASLYFGLSEEGRAFLYLSMGASLLTVVLAVAQLVRTRGSRVGTAPSAWDQPTAVAGPASDADDSSDGSNQDPSSSGSSRPD